MPALDDRIDDLFDTYIYYITTSDQWSRIKRHGLEANSDGVIPVLLTNDPEVIKKTALETFGSSDVILIKFNLCALGLNSIGELVQDPEAGGSPYRRIVRRNIIGPCHLEKAG